MTRSSMSRRLRVGVCRVFSDEHAPIVAEQTFGPGADVRLSGDPASGLVVPDWKGPPILLISGDGFLHLTEGMRVNMCDEHGAARIVGTYEELLATGAAMPIPILGRAMNIKVREGISVFAKYLADGE